MTRKREMRIERISKNINKNSGSAGAEKQIGRDKSKVQKREYCRMRAEDKDGGKVN
jgi:hypothetical protein